MKLEDLKNIDIKKINIAKIRSNLLKRQDILINYVAIFLTVFIMFKIFSSQQEETQNLKIQVSEMEKKIVAIAKYDQALKELNVFVESLPTGIPESLLIDKITDLAEKSNIHIVTFSPMEMEENELYKHIHVSLQVSADHYKDFIRFIHDIESSSLNLRVDIWSGSLEPRSQSAQFAPEKDKKIGQEDPPKILLNISSIYFLKKI